jgi:hypothetical protein
VALRCGNVYRSLAPLAAAVSLSHRGGAGIAVKVKHRRDPAKAHLYNFRLPH